MLALIKILNNSQLADLLCLKISNNTVGYIRPKLAEFLLKIDPSLISKTNKNTLTIYAGEYSASELADKFMEIHESGAATGILPKPANEFVDVRVSLYDTPFFKVNRNLIFPLGIKSWGVHLIITYENGDFAIARRSERVFTYKNCYDVPVGGLLPSGKDPWLHIIQEAAEEAGLPLNLVRCTEEAAVIAYARNIQGQRIDGKYMPAFPFETDGGTNRDEVFYWPVTIADDVELRPCDGEVKEFLRMTPIELIHSLKTAPETWKTNSALMIADVLARNPLHSSHFSVEERAQLQRLRIADPRPVGTRREFEVLHPGQ
jgi:hypothetical protein